MRHCTAAPAMGAAGRAAVPPQGRGNVRRVTPDDVAARRRWRRPVRYAMIGASMPRLAAALLIAAATVFLPAHAQERPRASDTLVRERAPVVSPITDRFALRALYFKGSADTRVRLDSSAVPPVPGTVIDAEGTLRLDDAVDLGRMELWFRFGDRTRLRVDYFKLNRFGATVLDGDLSFGDDLYLAGESIESSLDYRSLSFSFLYSFLRREKFELAAGIGVYLVDVQAAAEAVDRNAREEESGVAPVPTLALDGTWRFARRWSLNARGQYVSTTIDGIDGTLGEYHADVQYRWKRNLAVGLGYSALDVDIDVDPASGHDFPGFFRLKTDGPEFFLRFSF